LQAELGGLVFEPSGVVLEPSRVVIDERRAELYAGHSTGGDGTHRADPKKDQRTRSQPGRNGDSHGEDGQQQR
jgi:hypothetical protein